MCSVRTVQLSAESDDPYQTISYCWGDPSERGQLQINRLKMSVPASSARALRCLRLHDRDRVVWIDAICIDQNNLDERAQQVAMMADIYRRADGNLIYLGEPDELTQAAVHNIEEIMTEIKQCTKDLQDVKGTPFDDNWSAALWARNMLPCRINMDALNAFYSLP